jgi:hypothetical protein
MAGRRSKEQMDRIKKARIKKSGRFVTAKTVKTRDYAVKFVVKTRRGRFAYNDVEHKNDPSGVSGRQPRPKVPLLSGGKDPTLAERFEEELYSS